MLLLHILLKFRNISFCKLFFDAANYDEACDFIRQRRNYPPPVYNQRRVTEAPTPVLQEIDIDAEILIQNEIDRRENVIDVGEQNARGEAIAVEHAFVAENDIGGSI